MPPLKANRERPRRIRRFGFRFARFLAWLAILLVSSVLLVLVAGLVAYQYRVELLNDVLGRIVAPYEVEVEEFDFERLGQARIRGVTLTPRFSDRAVPLAYLDEVELTYDLATLRRSRQLSTIRIERPAVHLDEKLFDAFRIERRRRPAAKPAKAFDLSLFAFFTDSLEIIEGRLLLDLPWHPPVTADWEFRSGPLAFDRTGLTRSPLELTLGDVRLGDKAGAGQIETVAVSARIRRDLSRVDIDDWHLARPRLAFTPGWLSPRSALEPAPPEPEGDARQGSMRGPTGLDLPEKRPFHLLVKRFRIDGADLSLEGFDGEEGRPRIPDTALAGSLDWRRVTFHDGSWNSDQPVHLDLERFTLGAGDSRLVEVEGLSASVLSLGTLLSERRIESVSADSLRLDLTDAGMARFRPVATRARAATDPAPQGERNAARDWTFGEMAIADGRFTMRDFSPGGALLPEVRSGFRATIEGVTIGGDGISCGPGQEVVLRNTTLRAPASDPDAPPLLSFDRATLSGSWDEFRRHGIVDTLVVEQPGVRLTDRTLGDWMGSRRSQDESRETIGPRNRPVYQARSVQVTGGTLFADTALAGHAIPKISSRFSLETTGEVLASGSPAYRLAFSDVELRNHPRDLRPEGNPIVSAIESSLLPGESTAGAIAEERVITVRAVDVLFGAREILRERRIDDVRIEGAEVIVGKGLREIVRRNPGEEESEKDPTPAPEPEERTRDASSEEEPRPVPDEPAPSQEDDRPVWHIDRVTISDSRIRFDSLIPQVEGLEFSLETVLNDIPLTPGDLVDRDEIQKVEIADIEIRDPYDSFITVATLPTIFVEFSLAGLARQEIEKVDLIAPSLYVGQGLFWWIDYQRRFRQQNEGASIEFGAERDRESGQANWTIKQINAHAGKIVIAPKGVPVGMVPFPFSATTNMSDGRIALQLQIPAEEEYVYRFPDYRVELFGLSGDVDFNVPVEQVDNNLVQTFTLDRAVWRKYEAENLYLTVTFDAEGVYGRFGGDAYGGYAEGQFNYYLGGDGRKWDAWIAGTGLDSGPLSELIAPENFLMTGEVSLRLVSEGDALEFCQTTGGFTTTGPGWIDIVKLDTVIEKLPGDWSNLQRGLAEIGLRELKRFSYDSGSGDLYLLNRDGELQMRFDGPYGRRTLNFHVHDWRNDAERDAAGVADGTR